MAEILPFLGVSVAIPTLLEGAYTAFKSVDTFAQGSNARTKLCERGNFPCLALLQFIADIQRGVHCIKGSICKYHD